MVQIEKLSQCRDPQSRQKDPALNGFELIFLSPCGKGNDEQLDTALGEEERQPTERSRTCSKRHADQDQGFMRFCLWSVVPAVGVLVIGATV